jgi:hypothetical protein
MTWINMSDLLVQIVFGWPFIILSLLVSLISLITKRYWLLLVGAVLFAPFSYYLNGAPGIHGIGFAFPLFLAGAAFAVRANKMVLAWILILPAFLVSALIAFVVLSQFMSF